MGVFRIALLAFAVSLVPVSAAFKLGASTVDADYAPSNVGVIGLRYMHQRGSMSTVVEVYPNTPAQQAGLIPGDRIVAVEGIDITQYNADQVYQLIGGMPGTPITLTMMRCQHGCRSFDTTLTRVDMNAIASENVFKIYKYGL